MTQQYLRNCRLRLLNGVEQLDLSQLQVRFDIYQRLSGTPNHAVIRIYNIARHTLARAQAEFAYVDLAVGYGGQLTRLFFGQIRQYNTGRREDAANTFVDLICADGDYAHTWTTVNKTLAAGWRQQDAYEAVARVFADAGVPANAGVNLPGVLFPRGRVLYGAARDFMANLARNYDADWAILNGQLYFLPYTETLPGEAIEINAATGMLGLPAQTLEGVVVEALINPGIIYGATIHLNNADIQQAQLPLEVHQQAKTQAPSFDPRGLYKVYSIEHHGDTRANEWVSRMICYGLDSDIQTLKPLLQNALPNQAYSPPGYRGEYAGP
jgi:hypothetical protein